MMNPLLYLAFAASAAVGVGLWQQNSIDRVHDDLVRLTKQIVSVRDAVEVERGTLREARSRLGVVESRVQSAQAALPTPTGALPTPASEGWWPQGRPYFYLAKSFLPLARFRNHALTPEQIDPETRARMTDGDWAAPEVEYKLFENGELNPHMTMLLGMSEQETATVNNLWTGVIRDVETIEAARIERVDPPQQAEQASPGQLLVARIPGLSSETGPLLEQWRERLEQTLGPERTAILQEQVLRHADEHLDGFGSLQREFLYQYGNLWVRYVDQWGNRFYGSRTLNQRDGFGRYSHLFGPGGPCELLDGTRYSPALSGDRLK